MGKRDEGKRAKDAGKTVQSVYYFLTKMTVQLMMLADDDASMQKTMIQHLYATRKLLDRRARALKVTYDVFIFGLALSLGVFAFVLIRR